MVPRRHQTTSSPHLSSVRSTSSGNAAVTCSASSVSASSIAAPALTPNRSGALNLLLQQQNAVEQRLGGRRATRHVPVDRADSVAAAHDRLGVVLLAAAVGAGAPR